MQALCILVSNLLKINPLCYPFLVWACERDSSHNLPTLNSTFYTYRMDIEGLSMRARIVPVVCLTIISRVSRRV